MKRNFKNISKKFKKYIKFIILFTLIIFTYKILNFIINNINNISNLKNIFTFSQNNIVEGFNVYDYIDSHTYFLNEHQYSTGIFNLMENFKNTNCIGYKICGFPLIYEKANKKLYYYYETDYLLAQEIEKLDDQTKLKFHPFITAINNSEQSYYHVRDILNEYKGLWKGIGPIYLKNNAIYSNKNEFANLYQRILIKDVQNGVLESNDLVSESLEKHIDLANKIKYTGINFNLNDTYISKIINLAKKNNLIVHINYHFDIIPLDIEEEEVGLKSLIDFKEIISKSDNMNGFTDLYQDDSDIINFFKNNPNLKIIFNFNPFSKRSFFINNKIVKYDSLEFSEYIIKNFKNVTIDLSGQLLTNMFILEEKKKKVEDNTMQYAEGAKKFQTAINQMHSLTDVLKATFGPIDDYLSGKPLTSKEKKMSVSNIFSNLFKNTPNGPMDRLTQALRNTDPKQLDILANLFKEDPSDEEIQAGVALLEQDKKRMKENNRLDGLARLKMSEKDKEMDDYTRGLNDTIDEINKTPIDERDPGASYDVDGKKEKQTCPFHIPSYLKANTNFMRNLNCTPKETESDRKYFVGRSGGGPIIDEMDKESPSSSKVKKTAKKMAKKDKTPRTVKLISVERFDDYEGFTDLEDKMFKFAGKAGSVTRNYAERSTQLPTNTPPPNNGPITASEMKNTTFKSLRSGVMTPESNKLVSGAKEYTKSGKIVKDGKNMVVRQARNIAGVDKKGNTVLERPLDLYRTGYHQYIPAHLVYKYRQQYGEPEYEYIDEWTVVERKRKVGGTDNYPSDYSDSVNDRDDKNSMLNYRSSVRKGNVSQSLQDKIKNNNYADLPDETQKIIKDKIRVDNENKKSIELSNKLLDKIEDPNTTDAERKKLIKQRDNMIKKNFRALVNDVGEKKITTTINIIKYSYHDAKIKKSWIKLINKYPTQFIIGTGTKLDFKYYPSNAVLVNRVLAELDENKALKVARENILRML